MLYSFKSGFSSLKVKHRCCKNNDTIVTWGFQPKGNKFYCKDHAFNPPLPECQMVKPKNEHIKQMDLVSDSQLLELLQVEGYFY